MPSTNYLRKLTEWGFETEEEALQRKEKLMQSLQHWAALDLVPECTLKTVNSMQECEGGQICSPLCRTTICPVHLRQFRLSLLENAKATLNRRSLKAVTLIIPGLKADPGELKSINLPNAKRRLLTILTLAGLDKTVVLGGFDFSFNIDRHERWQPHWQVHPHLLIETDWSTRKLRTRLREQLKTEASVHRPVRTRKVRQFAKAVTYYTIKPVHFARESYLDEDGSNRTERKRLPVELQRELITWLSAVPLRDRLILVGLRRRRGTIERIDHERITRNV
jgi:hypothetical protein